MDLIIWRHAEAVDKTDDLADLERALTRRGQKQASRVGAWLSARLPSDVRILCSPALRCQQTTLGLTRRFEVRPELGPDAGAAAILETCGWPRAAHPVLVVGHQPALGELVARLLDIEGGQCEIEKGAVWWLRKGEEGARAEAVLRTVQSPDLI
ncbi:MAG: histidine phosphatase family protein [Comamonadaceae bacterium]|nr:MAG: histidine phosphatase family protein [Comamonadaceae bacterium]